MDQNESDAGSVRQLVLAPSRALYAPRIVPLATSIEEILNPDGSAKPPWRDFYRPPAPEINGYESSS